MEEELNATPTILRWHEPLPMEPGAPLPSMLCIESRLLCAYYIGIIAKKSARTSAVLLFDRVQQFRFGCHYNHENLTNHPLYKYGLRSYQFGLVDNSPLLSELYEPRGMLPNTLRHWIITFHDHTLEVVGDNGSVVGDMVAPPEEALRIYSKQLLGRRH